MGKMLFYTNKGKAVSNLNKINRSMNINQVDANGDMVKTKNHDYQWAHIIDITGEKPMNEENEEMNYCFACPESQWMDGVEYDLKANWKPEYRINEE